MLKSKFNLVDEPWIPVVGRGRVSLLDVFSDASLGNIDGNAVQKMSLIKLLIAIAQASVSIPDRNAWRELGAAGLADRSLSYLKQMRESFYLFGDNPFLQMPAVTGLGSVKEAKIYYDYIPDLASDNDSILREVQFERKLSDAEKAVFVVSLMDYALGGKRISSIEPLSSGFLKSKSAKSGPSLGNFVGYLHTFIQGSSILETVWFNFFTDVDIRAMSYISGVRPPWEKMPEGENDARAEELKHSIYSALVALSRFVLLGETGIYYVEGLQYPGSVKDGYYEPFITINQKELKTIYADVSKKPWRSLPSILQAAYEKNCNYGCAIIKLFLHRAAEAAGEFSIWTGGLRVRGTSGDQSVKQNDDYVESEFFLTQEALENSYYPSLCNAISRIDSFASTLRRAIAGYYGKDSEEIQKSACTSYWVYADSLSDEIISCWVNADKEGMEKRIMKLWSSMLSIYDDFCPHTTAQEMFGWMENHPGKFPRRRKSEMENKSAEIFIDYIFRHIKADKGFRAELRHAANPLLEYRVFPEIYHFVGDKILDGNIKQIYMLVASAAAKSGLESDGTYGFGRAMREVSDIKDSNGRKSFHPRFSRIVSIRSFKDLAEVLRPTLQLIASRNIPLDYSMLLSDLIRWNSSDADRTRVKDEWCADYLGKIEQQDEEAK